jgi:D-lactate dehydrogenase
MKIAFFNTKTYDKIFFDDVNKQFQHNIAYFTPHLTSQSAVLADGYESVCVFVNDELDRDVIQKLSTGGVKLIALRCAGFNNVDLAACRELGIAVARVPAYSPHGVAEHTVALMLALNRKIHRSHQRIREGNFSLDGLLGFEFYGLCVGIIGTGQIGKNVARIMHGFGSQVIAYDPIHDIDCEKMGVTYVDLDELYKASDVISLHVPLSPNTQHMINSESISIMKPGAMLINTSRGGLIDTKAVVSGLKSGQIGFFGLDVYEEEADVFFEDLSGTIIQDDVLARLMTFPNVIITGHQAFFTKTAMLNIAETTLNNIKDFETGCLKKQNVVEAEKVLGSH